MKLIFAVVLGLFSAIAGADSHWHTSKTGSIYPLAGGDFVLILKTPSPNCSSKHKKRGKHIFRR